ncbi:MAG TPA: DUF2059 domain-containing protein [Allosphingosinicella sp.]
MLAMPAGAALAQAGPAPAAAGAVDPAAVAAARDLLRATNYEAQLEETAQRVGEMAFSESIRAQEQQGRTLPADLTASVQKVLREETALMVQDLKKTALEDAARIYARYFTAAEIRELQQLQTRPVMVKAQSVMPQLMPELMQIGIKAAAARQPATQERIRKLVEAWTAKQR